MGYANPVGLSSESCQACLELPDIGRGRLCLLRLALAIVSVNIQIDGNTPYLLVDLVK